MKEFLLNNMEFIIGFVSALMTYILGKLAKKSKVVQDNKIPLQNVLVMAVSSLFYFAITGDFSMVVASGSPIATLFYDTINNLKKGY